MYISVHFRLVLSKFEQSQAVRLRPIEQTPPFILIYFIKETAFISLLMG